MTQHERIMAYLQDHGSITPIEAVYELGVTKLATRVSEMTRAGAQINKRMVRGVNRYGEPDHYMQYSLGER